MTMHTPQSFLKRHPRMLGVLFMTMLLLGQAGSVAACGITAIHGP